jgi:hypothetical protein
MCDFDDFGWEDMGIAGALAEEMAEEEKERRRLEREMEPDSWDSCCDKDDGSIPPDPEDFIP